MYNTNIFRKLERSTGPFSNEGTHWTPFDYFFGVYMGNHRRSTYMMLNAELGGNIMY